MSDEKSTVHDGASSFFETAEFNEWLRVKQQQDRMRAAELEYLEGAADHQDFRKRRSNIVVDDESPMDECDYRSYCARREAEPSKV